MQRQKKKMKITKRKSFCINWTKQSQSRQPNTGGSSKRRATKKNTRTWEQFWRRAALGLAATRLGSIGTRRAQLLFAAQCEQQGSYAWSSSVVGLGPIKSFCCSFHFMYVSFCFCLLFQLWFSLFFLPLFPFIFHFISIFLVSFLVTWTLIWKYSIFL